MVLNSKELITFIFGMDCNNLTDYSMNYVIGSIIDLKRQLFCLSDVIR